MQIIHLNQHTQEERERVLLIEVEGIRNFHVRPAIEFLQKEQSKGICLFARKH